MSDREELADELSGTRKGVVPAQCDHVGAEVVTGERISEDIREQDATVCSVCASVDVSATLCPSCRDYDKKRRLCTLGQQCWARCSDGASRNNDQ